MADGVIPLTTSPGLGIELDRDALAHFAEAARRLAERTYEARV